MTDIETTLRDGLSAYADETAHRIDAPALAEITLRARTSGPRRRRWPKVSVIVVSGALVTTGLAAATGVLPGPVEWQVREFRNWGFDANAGAKRVAWVANGDMTYELWRAPLANGGVCVYERAIGPEGDIKHGGSSYCGPGHYGSVSSDRTGPRHLASGQLPPGATHVVFTFADGTTFTVWPQVDRFYITAFAGVPDGSEIVGEHAFAANGREIPVQGAG